MRSSLFSVLPSKIANQTKKGVGFCQKSIGAVGCSLATLYDDWRRRATSRKLTGMDRQTDGRTGPRIESG